MAEVDWRGRGWRGGIFLLIATFVVAMDQMTKRWIRSTLEPYDSLPEVGFVQITHVQNTGAAFGLFTQQTVFLSIAAIIGLIIILIFYRYLSSYSILGTVALGLIFGGAIGNQIDRITLGHVTDFIQVHLWDNVYWPTFNIADSSITVGVIVLAIFILWIFRKEDNKSAESRK